MTKYIGQLLLPRYKLIADYPENKKTVGDIITVPSFITEFYDEYPHLFKELNWWEERTEEEMPMYLKYTYKEKTKFYKIEEWDMNSCLTWNTNPEFTYQPATEEEYLNSIK